MILQESSCSFDSQFVDRYEVLRHEASKYFSTSENCALGLNAFLHRGMLAWMKCWLLSQPAETAGESEKGNSSKFETETRQEIISVMANMVLNHQFGRDEYAESTA